MWIPKRISVVLVVLVLIPGFGCDPSDWRVDFTNSSPCGVRGSSVVLGCSYYYPSGHTVTKTTWYKGGYVENKWTETIFSDLPSYGGRIKYIGDNQQNCSLRISNLQDSDKGYYSFSFEVVNDHTTQHNGWSKYLNLTDLTVTVNPTTVREGEKVTLTCTTTCSLTGNPTMVWFKDGQPVPNQEFQARREDAGSYICAVKGQETVRSDPVVLDVQYGPQNVILSVSPPGEVVQGSSVTLTCSSDAKPAVDSYTWYRRTGPPSSSSLVGSGQVLSLASLDPSQTGHYLCQARNSLGENNSTLVVLEIEEDLENISGGVVAVSAGAGVSVLVVLTFIMVLIWCWRKRTTVDKDQSQVPGHGNPSTNQHYNVNPSSSSSYPLHPQSSLENVPLQSMTSKSQGEEEVLYSTVTVRPRESRPPHHTESSGNPQDHLQSAPQALRVQEADQDLYSTVKPRQIRPPQYSDHPEENPRPNHPLSRIPQVVEDSIIYADVVQH